MSNYDQVQQMMALAARGQQPQRGVDVGACGPMAYNPNAQAAPAQQGFAPVNPFGFNPPMPYLNGPMVAQNCSVYQRWLSPLGLNYGWDRAGNFYPGGAIGRPVSAPVFPSFGTTLRIFVPSGIYQMMGYRHFGPPASVAVLPALSAGGVITSIISGDFAINQVMGEVDPAAWGTDECFCPISWGCISTSNALQIQGHAVGPLPDPAELVQPFQGTLFGLWSQTLNACGPQTGCGPFPGQAF